MIFTSEEQAIATAQTERDVLLRECRQLLAEVAQRPNSLKLLAGVRDQLRMFAEYKAGRSR